jgi:GT2 family glycosyltransferase/SAM-dependent methyltransferase
VRFSRRAGAPRLIEWTGERCVPWAPDTQVVYEHFHRYLWAAGLVHGRRVLDLASGEGFGAAILVGSAEAVVGVDIDARTIEHSRLNYGDVKLRFELGDASDLSMFDDGSFGVVVAFEMIEHVEDQERVLAEIARVLEPGGLLVMSTPDRRAYSEATGVHNPFHTRELSLEEFVQKLSSTFAHTATWGQRTITGSVLSALDAGSNGTDPPAATSFFIERSGEEWLLASQLSPLYVVALASNAELPEVPSTSTLGDCGLTLLRDAEAAAARALGRADEERRQAAEAYRRLNETWEQRYAELDRGHAGVRRDNHELGQELAFRRKEAADLRAELRDQTARDQEAIASLTQQVRRVEQSVTWQLLQRVRGRLVAAVGGEHSPLIRALQATIRLTGRTLLRRRAPEEEPPALTDPGVGAPIELPEFEQPKVSLVIPIHAHAELTRACLESIRDQTSEVSYEVILVDDGADEATKATLGLVRGARVLVNPTNIGYLHSVKRGASAARGDWLVLCNNDIEVHPGWLKAMLDCALSRSDVAIVTPKYLYPDGLLNEAGGVIWQDGTGGNYGRGDEPWRHQYEYRREVDYGSAAALMVKAEFWRDVGGFDERFLPMYYEDTDLCFQARERGLRVLYEPRANVVHVEGATAGSDISVGHKRHQELNRPKFVEKWRSRLEADHLRPGPANVRRAANRHAGQHVLIVDHRVPMWDRDSGSVRMRGMIEALVRLGCRVTFLPDNLSMVVPYTQELQRIGVDVLFGELDVRAELAAIGPELKMAILCRPHTTARWLDLVRASAPSAHVVYDTVDLHWLRIARGAAIGAGRLSASLAPQATALRELELALVRATDATLVVSEDERIQVEADVPGAVVRVMPNVHELRTIVPSADQRKGVLFIGGFEHTPNVDAALRLVHRVMPLVWAEHDDVRVTIVGDCAPPEILELASSEVDIMGWVPDIDPLLDSARALVAPLSYGAGLKGKVTQALAVGLPVVTTPIGAEGLDAQDGEHLLIGDDDAELAAAVIRVVRDADLWERLSRSGQQLAAERCSPSVMDERLQQLLLGATAAANAVV